LRYRTAVDTNAEAKGKTRHRGFCDDLHRHAVYYVRVERRLGAVDQSVQAEGRAALRKMRADMLSGAFPVKRG
jgi:hypothetical protein